MPQATSTSTTSTDVVSPRYSYPPSDRHPYGRVVNIPTYTTRSHHSPTRQLSTATTWLPVRAHSSARPRLRMSILPTTSPSKYSTRLPTVPRYRCSSLTRRGWNATARTPCSCTATAASTSRSRHHSRLIVSPGWKMAAYTLRQICVAAANTANRGTRQAPRWRSSTYSTTSSQPLSTSSTKSGPPPNTSPSRAVATAVCS